MQVKILEHTKNPLKTIHTAARTCYSKDLPSNMHSSNAINLNLIKSVIDMGHHSVLEHVNITFAIEKISRACSHQLVRHRICSISQQSQRYVTYDDIDFIIPPALLKDDASCVEFQCILEDMVGNYNKLIDLGIAAEDARYILPNATATNITMTVNIRELIEMCKLRLCTTAQWEIRKMFDLIKIAVNNDKELNFFSKYLLPKCEWLKFCPEGKRCCGRYQESEGIKNG